MSHAERGRALVDSWRLSLPGTPETIKVRTTRWALVLALVGTVAHGAEVYRSTDANGVVSYSDRPEGSNALPVTVVAPRPGRPGNPIAPHPAQNEAGAQQAAAKPGDPAASPGQERVEPTAAEKAAERAKNCQTARERQQKYAVSHRLYRTLPNGEREYLNDGEIDEAKARAAADVETWCD